MSEISETPPNEVKPSSPGTPGDTRYSFIYGVRGTTSSDNATQPVTNDGQSETYIKAAIFKAALEKAARRDLEHSSPSKVLDTQTVSAEVQVPTPSEQIRQQTRIRPRGPRPLLKLISSEQLKPSQASSSEFGSSQEDLRFSLSAGLKPSRASSSEQLKPSRASSSEQLKPSRASSREFLGSSQESRGDE